MSQSCWYRSVNMMTRSSVGSNHADNDINKSKMKWNRKRKRQWAQPFRRWCLEHHHLWTGPRSPRRSFHCWLSYPIGSWDCYDRYFFFNRLSTFSWIHLILSRHVIIISQGTLSLYLFSHEISISPMLSQPSFNFRAVHGYAYFSSLPFWCLTHHTCYTSILCTAYLISAPTAQGLGFALCIQYW